MAADRVKGVCTQNPQDGMPAEVAGGRAVVRAKVVSPGASSLTLLFTELLIPASAELILYPASQLGEDGSGPPCVASLGCQRVTSGSSLRTAHKVASLPVSGGETCSGSARLPPCGRSYQNWSSARYKLRALGAHVQMRSSWSSAFPRPRRICCATPACTWALLCRALVG